MARKSNCEGLAREASLLQVILDNIDQGILLVDREMRVVKFNRRLLELFDYMEEAVAEQSPFEEVLRRWVELCGQGPEMLAQAITQAYSREPLVIEIPHPGNRWIEIRHTPLADGGLVRTFTDVTDRKLAQERLSHLAQHDMLTDLPNRMLFHDRLQHAIQRAGRQWDRLAVLYVDLDRFKEINDRKGHKTGDQLLQEVATRLRSCVRDSDTVSRMGGDEFTVLLEGLRRGEAAELVAGKILEAMARPFLLNGEEVRVGASIGISLFPHDGEDVDPLLHGADRAMYRAKQEGGNCFRFFGSKGGRPDWTLPPDWPMTEEEAASPAGDPSPAEPKA